MLESRNVPGTPSFFSGRPFAFVCSVLGLASLAIPLRSAGLWNPHELDVVELGRRIALHLMGGNWLVIEGADNLVPIQGDLGRGELPFLSIALGLRAFGLHDWAARLPLVLWALLGLGATYVLVARLADRLAASLSVLVLATTPLYFLHARTAMGDIVPMSSLAVASAGLALGVFDRRLALGARSLAVLLGVAGLGAGFLSRGMLLGVSVPPLSIGMAFLLLRAGRSFGGPGRILASACLAVGALGAALACYAWFATRGQDVPFSWLMGSRLPEKARPTTFDAVLGPLAHGTFPWSALFPVAVATLLGAPRSAEGAGGERNLALRVFVLVSALLGYVAHAFAEPATGAVPFGLVFALSVIVALAICELNRDGAAARWFSFVGVAFAVVLAFDLMHFPEKALSAFSVAAPVVPDTFEAQSRSVIRVGTLGFCALLVLFLAEPDGTRPRFDYRECADFYEAFGVARQGRPAPWVWLVQTLFLLSALLLLLSDRYLHLPALESLFVPARWLLQFGWLAWPAVLFAAPALVVLLRDVFRWGLVKLRLPRALGALFAGVLFGLGLSLYYYPALLRQLSPLEAFESYAKLKKADEPLGLTRKGSAATARYYTGSSVEGFAGSEAASDWLLSTSERRWLILGAEDLPKLNSRYRAKATPRRNLPVLDARSSEILLVSNRLDASEVNQNPLSAWVLAERPRPAHALDGNLDGKLDVLGWEVRAPDGTLVDAVSAGRDYELSIYYQVVAPISGQWSTFVHIDGEGRRYNGDHKTLGGKYPFQLWLVGDFIADRHTIHLEPHFTRGSYALRFGLYVGKSRLPVKRGDHDDNRLSGGRFLVQ